MIGAAGLLALALLGQAQPRTYHWRDTAGQVHVTNTPPPADAELLEAPAPLAVEPGQAGRPPDPVRQSASRGGREEVVLNPAQQQSWADLDRFLAKARAEGNRQKLEAATDSLIEACLWGSGLWIMPALPLLSVLLMGFMGWWLALGLRPGLKIPLMGGFVLLGMAFGHLLLNAFFYHPQALRLRQNLALLEVHMGTGKPLRPERRALLRQRYQALEQAADPLQVPWRFPAEVKLLRASMKQVMVEP